MPSHRAKAQTSDVTPAEAHSLASMERILQAILACPSKREGITDWSGQTPTVPPRRCCHDAIRRYHSSEGRFTSDGFSVSVLLAFHFGDYRLSQIWDLERKIRTHVSHELAMSIFSCHVEDTEPLPSDNPEMGRESVPPSGTSPLGGVDLEEASNESRDLINHLVELECELDGLQAVGVKALIEQERDSFLKWREARMKSSFGERPGTALRRYRSEAEGESAHKGKQSLKVDGSIAGSRMASASDTVKNWRKPFGDGSSFNPSPLPSVHSDLKRIPVSGTKAKTMDDVGLPVGQSVDRSASTGAKCTLDADVTVDLTRTTSKPCSMKCAIGSDVVVGLTRTPPPRITSSTFEKEVIPDGSSGANAGRGTFVIRKTAVNEAFSHRLTVDVKTSPGGRNPH